MTNLEKAVRLYFEEEQKRFDKEFQEAMARGELPQKTSEELKAEADAIWYKVHGKKSNQRAG